ncbi:hypothetical protein [Pseudomonas sp.]|uniref:hypothetical protein n=1 Tax=Pseudomonas sp. TaxID=306 RepID=UPI002587192A|nr:hypothetical protein [Pseudomonas sp.]
MDNPSPESSTTPLNLDGAAAAFADILEPKAAEATEEAQPTEAAATQEQPAPEATDAPDVEMVEIDVDGYKVALPKDKAEKLEAERLMQADYTKKTMAAAEERKAAQAQSQQALQERQAYAQNLSRMQAQLEGALAEQNQSVNWQQLLETDPQQYLQQKHLWEQRQAALQQTYAQQQHLASIHQAEQQQRFQSHLQAQQQELLAKLPEWKDESKAKAEKVALREYLLSQGYDAQSVSNVADAKAVLLARKAMLYDQMISKAQVATKKVATLPSKVERPGSGANPSLDKRSGAFQRLSKSGSVDDAAAVFATLL